MKALRLGIFGATGAVGQELLALIEERGFSFASLRLFASPRSAGQVCELSGQSIVVEASTDEPPFGELDLAWFCAGGGFSRRHGEAAVAAGCCVIDNSSAFRMNDDVALVIPELNAHVLGGLRPQIIANPNCTTIVNSMVAGPLHRRFVLQSMVVASYQAASGAGTAGLKELRNQVRAYALGDRETSSPEVFAEPLAFNLIPEIGALMPSGATDEEEKMTFESRKILCAPALQIATTCVRVPVERAHGVATVARFERWADSEAAREVLRSAPGVRVVERPTPLRAAGKNEVLVGRLRTVAEDGRSLAWFAVGDQIRKGAALNAIQIAEGLADTLN